MIDESADAAAYFRKVQLSQLARQLAGHLSIRQTCLPTFGTLREWRPTILVTMQMAEKLDRSVTNVVYREGVDGDHLRPGRGRVARSGQLEPDMAIGTVYYHPDEGYTVVVWPHGAKPAGPFEDLDAVRMYLCVLLNSKRGRWT